MQNGDHNGGMEPELAYSNKEALAHELQHAHDDLVDKANRARGHGDGFWEDEKAATGDARKCH